MTRAERQGLVGGCARLLELAFGQVAFRQACEVVDPVPDPVWSVAFEKVYGVA